MEKDTEVVPPKQIRIVVLDRGFVFVGEVSMTDEFMYIDKAQTIRRWGTDAGLGQLVSGPRPETILDLVVSPGVVRVPNRAVIFDILVDQTKWQPTIG